MERLQIESAYLLAWNIRSLVDQPSWHMTDTEHRFYLHVIHRGIFSLQVIIRISKLAVSYCVTCFPPLGTVYGRIARFGTKSQEQKSEDMVLSLSSASCLSEAIICSEHSFCISHEATVFSKYLVELVKIRIKIR